MVGSHSELHYDKRMHLLAPMAGTAATLKPSLAAWRLFITTFPRENIVSDAVQTLFVYIFFFVVDGGPCELGLLAVADAVFFVINLVSQ